MILSAWMILIIVPDQERDVADETERLFCLARVMCG